MSASAGMSASRTPALRSSRSRAVHRGCVARRRRAPRASSSASSNGSRGTPSATSRTSRRSGGRRRTRSAGSGCAPPALGRGVVHPEVEDRVHHSRHRRARARPHADEQRRRRVAEAHPRCFSRRASAACDLGARLGAGHARTARERVADLGRDREARRYGQPEGGHLRQPGALASELVAPPRVALGSTFAEEETLRAIHLLPTHPFGGGEWCSRLLRGGRRALLVG